MNIVLIGKSGSGKTEICKRLVENLRYDKVVSYTTRKIREGEEDKVDYNFVTDEEFDKIETVLTTKVSGNMYGVKLEDVSNCDNKVIIVDEVGLKELSEIENFKYMSFFIDANTHKRYCRCLNRGDKFTDVIRRIFIEDKRLDNVQTDFIADNNCGDVWTPIINILEKIKEGV